jgi:hypothetical protein
MDGIEAVSGWPLQRIHALRAIRTVHVQQRLAVSQNDAHAYLSRISTAYSLQTTD